MPVDLDAPLTQTLEQACKQGESLRERGRFNEAASQYEHAARLAHHQAKHTVPMSRLRKLAYAERLERIAEELRNRRPDVQIETGSDSHPSEDTQLTGEAQRIAALRTSSQVSWDDVVGLAQLKCEIRMLIRLVTAQVPAGVKLQTNRSLLLYGPPGTGKSMIGSAVAAQMNGAFYMVSASDLLSKWFGESARLAAELYRQARKHPVSVIFIDEIDALCRSRDASVSGPERRLLATLLTQMSGVEASQPGVGKVITLAATNTPWDIDPAALSRFSKRMYVPLPDSNDRQRLIESTLAKQGLVVRGSIREAAESAQRISPRQIIAAVQDAVMKMLLRCNPKVLDTDSHVVMRVESVSARELQEAMSSLVPDVSAQRLIKYETW